MRRGVEVPRDNERDRPGGKAAGLLVPRSEPGDFVEELLCLRARQRQKEGVGKEVMGGSRFRDRKQPGLVGLERVAKGEGRNGDSICVFG